MVTNSSAYSKEWRLKNRDKVNAYQRSWRAKNSDKVKRYERVTRKRRHGAEGRKWRFKYKYGLTEEKYNALLASQLHKCAACQTNLRALRPAEVHIDHCHKTNVIRAILCGPCNRALGLMKDNAENLYKLAKYASKFS